MRGRSTGFAVAAVVLALAVPSADAALRPALHVSGTQPLVVQGTSFRPGERVTLTAMTLLGARRAIVRASPSGHFEATFRLPAQPCGSAFALRAVGALGNRVTLGLPSRACIPPPIR
jgi:hypothetical protein